MTRALDEFINYLEDRLATTDSKDRLTQIFDSGESSAGKHSMEEVFTRELLCPLISKFFREDGNLDLKLTDEEITCGLGTEGYQKCEGFGFTPARRGKHLFTKGDIIRPEPPAAWTSDSETRLPKFQACPDFAISDPLPIKVVGEVKLVKSGSPESAIKELYNATRQAMFYLGAFRNEYEVALIVMADVSDDKAVKKAMNMLNRELLSRFGSETGIFLAAPILG